MKLNLTQYNPDSPVRLPGGAGFFFTRDVAKNLKEHFVELRECEIGLCSEQEASELPKFLSGGWQRIHIKEDFTADEREESKNKLRAYCGCHIGDDGFVKYSHYFVMYMPRELRKQQYVLERKYNKSQIEGSLPQEDGMKSSLEEEKITLQPPDPEEIAKRGPGRLRKET